MAGPLREKANFVYRKRRATLKTVLIRFGALLLIIGAISTIVYLDRPGYKFTDDEKEGDELTPIDAVYFTVVSITTTGYGDIVPVNDDTKIIDAVFITIGRAALWFVIVGTAYQFIFERYREAFMMRATQKRLTGHTIIAGFSTTGESAARELVAKGNNKSSIVVITTDPEAAQKAAEEGYVSIVGDATRECILEAAVIKKASSLIIATRKDDSNILVALTARYLNPDIRIISRVTELENIKLLKKSGVEVIIAPAVTSGNLMAAATTQPNVVHLLEDVMTASAGMYISEREARPDELGAPPKKLRGAVVIGLVRNGKVHSFDELDEMKVREKDHLLLLERK